MCAPLSNFNPHAGTQVLSQDALIAVAVESSAVVFIAVLFFIIGCYCGRFQQIRKYKSGKGRALLRRPTSPPRCRETYYNMPLCSQQDNMEMTEQKPNRPVVMYDDILPPSQQDNTDSELHASPAKPRRPVVTYDDVLSPREQDSKGQNTTKPKVMYDEVIPPGEQDRTELKLKKNTAYRPAESK